MVEDLTIVIPSKNEEDNIRQLFKEISRQGLSHIKIILADANSSDSTRLTATETSKSLGLNLEIIDGGLPAKGRNRGADLANSEWILFLDADITFTKNANIWEIFTKNRNEYKLISTTPVMRGIDPAGSLLMFINKISTIWLSKKDPFAVGGFTLVRKDHFINKGGYDESLKHTEDWIFSRKTDPSDFLLIPGLITQDNRRFKKFGYFRMIRLMVSNWINRGDIEHFRKDENYW